MLKPGKPRLGCKNSVPGIAEAKAYIRLLRQRAEAGDALAQAGLVLIALQVREVSKSRSTQRAA